MVICCAAISKPSMFLSCDIEQYKNHFDVNFFGNLKFILPIAKRMALRNTIDSRIVIVGDSIS